MPQYAMPACRGEREVMAVVGVLRDERSWKG
jgi:hypothetical protein